MMRIPIIEPTSKTEKPEPPQQAAVRAPKTKKRRLRFLRPRTMLIILVLLLALLPGAYFYYKNQQTQARLNNPDAATTQEINDLSKRVGRHILLPTGETPTVATVTDTSKLAGQQFFLHAEKGDKVLVYTQARKAYLYRPSEDKLIEVAPLSVGSATPS